MNKPLSILTGLAVIAGSLFVATPANAVQAGQYCAHRLIGTKRVASNGDIVQCKNKNGIRWIAVSHPNTSTSIWKIDEDERCSYAHDLMMEKAVSSYVANGVTISLGETKDVYKCSSVWIYKENDELFSNGWNVTWEQHFDTAYSSGSVIYNFRQGGGTTYAYSCKASNTKTTVWDMVRPGDAKTKTTRYYCHKTNIFVF